MTQRPRDILLLIGSVVAAVIVGAVLRRFLEPRWEFMLAVVALFAACAAVKARWPAHSIMGSFSWRYLVLAFIIVETVALVLADRTLVGVWWTIPAVVCRGLAYCFVHLVLGHTEDDGWAGNAMMIV